MGQEEGWGSGFPSSSRGCGRAGDLRDSSRDLGGCRDRPLPALHLGPWGKGGRAPPRSPSTDGEMWPFTFTLQCQPLNHCLPRPRSRLLPGRPPTKPPPPPPGTRAPSPLPRPGPRPRGPGRARSAPGPLRPAAFLSPPDSLISICWSQGPISGKRHPEARGPDSPETSSSSLPYGKWTE